MNVLYRLECVTKKNVQYNHESMSNSMWVRKSLSSWIFWICLFFLLPNWKFHLLHEIEFKCASPKSGPKIGGFSIEKWRATNQKTKMYNNSAEWSETRLNWLCAYETHSRWKSIVSKLKYVWIIYVHSCLLSKSRTFWHEFILKICYRHI